MQATPVLFGRTEPPGRLPSCARLPSHECITGRSRLSPVLPGSYRELFILTAPGLAWAHLRTYAPAAVRRAEVSTLPLSVRLQTAPPGRLHPCTRTPIASSRIPRRYQALYRNCGSCLEAFILTAPGLTWANLLSFRGSSSAA